MADPAVPIPDTTNDPPTVLDAELVDLDALTPQTLQFPPVVATCRCGNVTERGHGLIPDRTCQFSCDEVLAMRASVERHARGRVARLFRWGGA
jgi:hypothetical protein